MPATLPFMMIGPPELPSSILPSILMSDPEADATLPLDHTPLPLPLTKANRKDVFSPPQNVGTPTQRLDLLSHGPVADYQVHKTPSGSPPSRRPNLRGDRSPLVVIKRDLWLRIAFNHVGSRRNVDQFAVNAHDETRARPRLPLRQTLDVIFTTQARSSSTPPLILPKQTKWADRGPEKRIQTIRIATSSPNSTSALIRYASVHNAVKRSMSPKRHQRSSSGRRQPRLSPDLISTTVQPPDRDRSRRVSSFYSLFFHKDGTHGVPPGERPAQRPAIIG